MNRIAARRSQSERERRERDLTVELGEMAETSRRCVTDGEELMDYLRRGKFAPPVKAPRPGLTLLDLNMPRKDRREALREINSDPELRSIDVVVLTTSETREDIRRTYELGAYSYIGKPVSFEGLVNVTKVVGESWFQIVKLPGSNYAS